MIPEYKKAMYERYATFQRILSNSEYGGILRQRNFLRKGGYKKDRYHMDFIRNAVKQRKFIVIKIRLPNSRGSPSVIYCTKFRNECQSFTEETLNGCLFYEECKGNKKGVPYVEEYLEKPMIEVELDPKPVIQRKKIDCRTYCNPCSFSEYCKPWVGQAIGRLIDTSKEVFIYEGVVSTQFLDGLRAVDWLKLNELGALESFPCQKMVKIFYEYHQIKEEMVQNET